MDDITIRAAAEADIAAMQHIEIVAGQAFLAVGMPEIAGDEPFSDERLRDYIGGGRAWVADAGGRSVGYILADVVDGAAHVEQVSVHPDVAGRLIGSRLIDTVAAWAAAHNRQALTLTTFRDVPWNAPYYERLGFVRLADDELTDGLRALMAMEAEHGLEPAKRVAMRRAVDPSELSELSG